MAVTTFYMATSLNGLICRNENQTNFISDDEWKNGFIPTVNSAGNIIIGRKTYEVMVEAHEFEHLPKNLLVIIVTRNTAYQTNNKNHVCVRTPKLALDEINNRNFEMALVAGGTALNSSFLEKALIDKVVVDIEPILVASGKQLYQSELKDINLKLEEVKNLTDNLLQLHYTVEK